MNMLTITLDPRAKEPLYEQLYGYIKREIQSGRFPCGGKLPSKRELAAHLQCSRNTIQNAYSQLLSEGYISARARSGYYIAEMDGIIGLKPTAPAEADDAVQSGEAIYNFSYHGVDGESFPYAAWRKITKDVIDEYDPDLLRLGHPQGDFKLRSAIAHYLHQSRGVVCSPRQIVISAGTEFLLQLLIQMFSEDCIYALENPGYEKLSQLLRSSRADYVPVPLDEKGMIPEALIQSGAHAAFITPSHQFPTGCIMPASRRIQLLKWANQGDDRYIIEDDYDSEFKYSGKPIPSLQGLDHGGKVIYIGAFSKSLTPSIRISYMVLPEKLLEVYLQRMTFYICPVPVFEQKALFRFISLGHFERHLNRMRKVYKKKREVLANVIQKLMPGAEIIGANVGLHFLLRIRNGMNEDELIAAARRLGVKVYGLSQYAMGDGPAGQQPLILLGYAAMKEKDLETAAGLLKKAWF